MFSKVIKAYILLFCFKQIYVCVNGQTICELKKFDSIYTNEMFVDDENDTNILVDIIIGEKKYIWNQKTNNISEATTLKRVLLRIFISTLPNCSTNDDDCQELYKLSNTAITFSRDISRLSYKITKFSEKHSEEECNSCDLPWNMSSSGDPRKVTKYSLWPEKWIIQEKLVATYDPFLRQLVFVINPISHDATPTWIMWKPITSKGWAEKWESLELANRLLLIGMVPLMAIKRNSNQKNLDRIFAFIFRQNEATHDVYELINNNLVKSDYDYPSLFHCPKLVKSDSSLGLYLLIGVTVITILIVLVIIYCVAHHCRQKNDEETNKTGFQALNSSSGGLGSKSSKSFP